ncbi:monocarboxylate transporter 12-like isoform X2 [Amphiura filiformis]|uniref:monocarboxylate transporter 12-like isoform X2 n=1 Tax=Amphiura filiformis TaxID=82378 RepID=UPI003B219906
MAKINHNAPPDGRWGWLVTLGAFVSTMLQTATATALGVLVPELSDGLDIRVGDVGTSFSVALCLKSMLGPVCAACMLCANARTLTFLGGILTGLGFIVAGFSTNQIHLTLSMVISSCGLGIALVTAPAILKEYFHKKYGLATGLASCGAAIGMIIFPPVMEILIDMFGWRNALFLLGAWSFNQCVAGAIYRPLNSSFESRLFCNCKPRSATCSHFRQSLLNLFGNLLSFTGINFLMKNKGYVFDATGSYNWAFYTMAGAELCAAVLVYSLNLMTRFQRDT